MKLAREMTQLSLDTSDEDDDEETLQDCFQLRSRFSRPGLPHIPVDGVFWCT
jgi:hypothetical protein